MLGPVCVALSLGARRLRAGPAERPSAAVPVHKLVPWFIVGFLVLVAARALGLIPLAVLPPFARIAGLLTVISMAALGLGTDIRALAKAGGRVTAATTASLLVLGLISLALIHLLKLS
jgi:uncharacterized membrane protein YadS